MASYYDMARQSFVWINGSALLHLEPLLPEVTVIEFGFTATQCEALIAEKLKIFNGQQDA
jgi:hypothetical protein